MMVTIEVSKLVNKATYNVSVSYDASDDNNRALALEEVQRVLSSLGDAVSRSAQDDNVVMYSGGKLAYTTFKGKQVLRWYGDKWHMYGVPVYEEVLSDEFKSALDGKLSLTLAEHRTVKVAIKNGKPVKVVSLV